jgi:enoyl-CoA hydratase
LEEALEGNEPLEAILARFAAPAPHSALIQEAETLEACFSWPDRESILAALGEAEGRGVAVAATARKAMLSKSPTSQAIALRQMAMGRNVDFDQVLRVDYRIVSRICRRHDFYEGVRAVIVDKDNRPVWDPPPSDAEVDTYFAPLGEEELAFPVRKP